MLSAQVESLGQMRLVEKPIPVPGDDSLLIKVEACAICGSDVRIFRNGDSRARYPIVIGHEIAGTVIKVGKNVTGLSEGDRVALNINNQIQDGSKVTVRENSKVAVR